MKLKNLMRWILAQVSVVTMVMMPVAQGQAAQTQQQEISKAMVSSAIYEMGLNKSITYGEFFRKNKDKYPVRLQKKLAPYFSKFEKMPMPQFDVDMVKGSDGVMRPVLRISQNGELHNVQLFGETEKYAKFDNTNLTEVDIINFDDMLIRLAAGDMKLNQQVNPETAPPSFSKSPDMTKEIWIKLTPQQRAGYVISMRLLYNDAHGVLLASKTKKNTNKKNKKFSFLESLVNKAYAVPALMEGDSVDDDQPAVSNSLANGGVDSCLVAGYVTKYKGKVCRYTEMKAAYKNSSSLAAKAIAACGNNIACNPLVFGTPNGNPICIPRSNNKDVQIATHYEGPCERGNHTNSKINFLNNPNDQTGRYSSQNVKLNADQIKETARKEQVGSMYKATEDFISGVLKYKDPSGDMQKLFLSKTPDQNVIDQLLQIKKDFDSEIKQATDACKAASQNNGYHEKNFWGACDQLQRRFLFIKEYLQKNPGCADGGMLNNSFKCSCVEGSVEKEVLPGAKCTIKPADAACAAGWAPSSTVAKQCVCEKNTQITYIIGQPVPDTCKSAQTAQCLDGKYNPSTLKCTCPPNSKEAEVSPTAKCEPKAITPTEVCSLKCEAPAICKNVPVEGTDRTVEECVGGGPIKPPVTEKKKSKWGNFFEKALPWIAGAGVIAAMYFLWKPKKPKLNAAADTCPNGLSAPCGVACIAPHVYVAGSGCGCAACPPGQTITNVNLCQCGTVNTGQIVCADGITVVSDIANCPAAQYTCWDGTVVANAINCPERPPGSSPTSGKTTR